MNRVRMTTMVCIILACCAIQPASGQAGWRLIRSGSTERLYAVQFLGRARAYTGGEHGTVLIAGDVDGGVGEDWFPHMIPTNQPVRALSFNMMGHGWVVTGDVNKPDSSGEIWKTTDHGSTWVKQAFGSTRARLGVSFVNDTVGWSCGAGDGALDIIATTDGGVSWHSQVDTTIPGWTYGIKALNAKTVWAVGGSTTAGTGYIVCTTNGGTSWKERNVAGLPVLYAIDFPNAVNGYAVGAAGAVYATSDSGRTWIPRPTGSTKTLRSVSFESSEHGWVCGDSGALFETTDGGLHWKNATLASGTNLYGISMAETDHTFAVGDSGTIWASGTPMDVPAAPAPDRVTVSAYPVPASAQITFHFAPEQMTRGSVIRLTDVLGREVARVEDIRTSIVTLDAHLFRPGVYFYDLTRHGVRIAGGRCIVSGR